VVAVFLGLAFFAASTDLGGFQNGYGSLFFLLILFAFSSISALDLFISERPIFVRERANGCYQVSAYYVSKIKIMN